MDMPKMSRVLTQIQTCLPYIPLAPKTASWGPSPPPLQRNLGGRCGGSLCILLQLSKPSPGPRHLHSNKYLPTSPTSCKLSFLHPWERPCLSKLQSWAHLYLRQVQSSTGRRVLYTHSWSIIPTPSGRSLEAPYIILLQITRKIPREPAWSNSLSQTTDSLSMSKISTWWQGITLPTWQWFSFTRKTILMPSSIKINYECQRAWCDCVSHLKRKASDNPLGNSVQPVWARPQDSGEATTWPEGPTHVGRCLGFVFSGCILPWGPVHWF